MTIGAKKNNPENIYGQEVLGGAFPQLVRFRAGCKVACFSSVADVMFHSVQGVACGRRGMQLWHERAHSLAGEGSQDGRGLDGWGQHCQCCYLVSTPALPATLRAKPSARRVWTNGPCWLLTWFPLSHTACHLQGKTKCKTWSDKWTVVTADGGLAAQYEHTILITPDGAEILTKTD